MQIHRTLLAATIVACVFPALRSAGAQFDDAPSRKEAVVEKQLDGLKRNCEKKDGLACYSIAQMVEAGTVVTGQSKVGVLRELYRESCDKGYQPACSRAQSETYAAYQNNDAKSADPTETTPKAKSHGLRDALRGLAEIGSGVAAGVAAGPNATPTQISDAIASGMSVTASLLGDDEMAKLYLQGTSGGGVNPQASAATSGGIGSRTTTSGGSYSGPMSAHVQYILARVGPWQCPVNNQGGAPPRMGIRNGDMRDTYVAAAASIAWAMECYAREGESAKASQYVSALRENLDNANALCSSAPSVSGRGAPVTLSVWGCPPPIR